MKLTHPNSGQVIETGDPDMYLSQGWQPVQLEEDGHDADEDEGESK